MIYLPFLTFFVVAVLFALVGWAAGRHIQDDLFCPVLVGGILCLGIIVGGMFAELVHGDIKDGRLDGRAPSMEARK